ncbi:unnamed protein product [Caenorhabditis auriculariae]|uniref:Uncharacterized protein n=1 Tax=Caenorhabditis auriculariae TaxID=2777116 RepID=A0A8S1GRT2_9PELO|nr:unnamed protein product [Caenorhabditis auriculariae]
MLGKPFRNVISVFAMRSSLVIIVCIVSISEAMLFITKKSHRYDNPPFCFAYKRNYDSETDATIDCSGYQYDCINVFDDTPIGEVVNFDLENCPSNEALRAFAAIDYPIRIAKYKINFWKHTTKKP